MKIAWFTPLSPVKSGISQYSEDLLPFLGQYCKKIDIFIDDYISDTSLSGFKIYTYKDFKDRCLYKDYDFIIYNMGNNPYHHYMFPLLLEHKGIVVLHDPILHHSFAVMTIDKGKNSDYISEMEYNYGGIGRTLAELRVKGVYTGLEQFILPLNKRVIESGLGVIVHSKYYKREIAEQYPNIPLSFIPMGIPLLTNSFHSKEDLKRLAGIATDTFIIGMFGFIEPMKQPETVIRAFHRFLQKCPNSLLLMVGEANPICRIDELLSSLDLDKKVLKKGYVSMEEFLRYMNMIDIGVNLRYPTAGETSAAVLRMLGKGKPVVVLNYRQFSELPDTCCPKVGLGENAIDELSQWFLKLAQDPDMLALMGDFAVEYIRERHNLEGAAKRYIGFLEQMNKGKH
ncbi:MAG: glycosyltransferase family 4 protein [Nitrospirae bacterium]|nr:glycosyltransferase family 4 protein [Nitrospirota bacterium]